MHLMTLKVNGLNHDSPLFTSKICIKTDEIYKGGNGAFGKYVKYTILNTLSSTLIIYRIYFHYKLCNVKHFNCNT